jgi:hypothetical protein
MRMKVVIVINSHNMGVVHSLFEKGDILKYWVPEQTREEEPQQTPAQVFVNSLRKPRKANGSASNQQPKTRVSGVRVVECALAVLQRRPTHEFSGYMEIGEELHVAYGFDAHSASPAVSTLIRHGYAVKKNGRAGPIVLTEKGKNHPQSEKLPF